MFTEYKSRILILGTRISGVYDLQEALQVALVGKREGAATSVDVIRFIDKIVPNITQPEAPTLRGIVLFPEMRTYVGLLPRVVHVYEEGIDEKVKRLCNERNALLFEAVDWRPGESVELFAKLLE